MKTNVLFLKESIVQFDSNKVFAYFPEISHDSQYNTCYAHIGQHSPCSPSYANECKEAYYHEYSDLLKELIGIGYKNLHILNKQAFEYHRNPTPREIKFGHGATHYRYAPLADIGITCNGDLKKWYVSPYDGLRYYR